MYILTNLGSLYRQISNHHTQATVADAERPKRAAAVRHLPEILRQRGAIKTIEANLGKALVGHRSLARHPHSLRYFPLDLGCFKKILNNLKLPLFNYKIYDKIISYNAGD